ELQPFESNQNVYEIVNPDGMCVTVDGTSIGEGNPLVLAQCEEMDSQGWVSGEAFRSGGGGGGGGRVIYGTYTEPEYYWYEGHRHCWYDFGWHGPGWYWCGENLNRGIGWGGPIGWHFWYHVGHRILIHRVFFKPHHGHPGHPHGPVKVGGGFGTMGGGTMGGAMGGGVSGGGTIGGGIGGTMGG